MRNIKQTFVLGARPAMRAAAALPALFSSMKLMVELMTRRQMIPTKSCQSGGLPSPLAKAIAMIAAASITHERGFHMNPKNLRILLSCKIVFSLTNSVTKQQQETKSLCLRKAAKLNTFFSSSLLGPKIWILSSPSWVVKPSLVHFSCWKTSSMGIFSCKSQSKFWSDTRLILDLQ